MKNLIFFFLLVELFFFNNMLFCEENDHRVIDNSWVKLRIKLRENCRCRTDVFDMDKQIINSIQKREILPTAESDLSDLIYEIAVTNMKYDVNTARDCFDILKNKFYNKNYFYNVSETFINYHYRNNPYIIEKIINNISELIENDTEKSLHALKIIYTILNLHYKIEPRLGPYEYGTDRIATNLIAILRKYSELIKENKIKVNPENQQIVNKIYRDLAIEGGYFDHLDGAQELVNEFNQ